MDCPTTTTSSSSLHPTPLLLLLHTGSQPPTQPVTSSPTGRLERRQTNRPARSIPSRFFLFWLIKETPEQKRRMTSRCLDQHWVWSAHWELLRPVSKSVSPGLESRFHRWHNGLLQRAMHPHLYLHFTVGELTHTSLGYLFYKFVLGNGFSVTVVFFWMACFNRSPCSVEGWALSRVGNWSRYRNISYILKVSCYKLKLYGS